jgi:hypothetical protein
MLSMVALFSACFDACSFSSNCGNNVYHFLTGDAHRISRHALSLFKLRLV